MKKLTMSGKIRTAIKHKYSAQKTHPTNDLVNIGFLDLVLEHFEGCVEVIEHAHDLRGPSDVTVPRAVLGEAYDALKVWRGR